MIRKTTLKQKMICVLLFFYSFTQAQDKVYADAVFNESAVDLSNNAIDSNLTTSATIRANSGVALGIGAYDGYLELLYPSTLPANTTSYLKVESEDDLLSSLLGGSLGDLLSNVVGTLLIGNQEFSVTVLDNSNIVLHTSSSAADAFGSDEARVTIDKDGDYFLALTPSGGYDRVRLTNSVGSLLGLGAERDLEVYGVFYVNEDLSCGAPSYTSFNGSGISLDLLELGNAGVTNPEYAIDGDRNTFSELGLGAVGVASQIEQTIYFDTTEDTGDTYYIEIGIDPSLLQLDIANSIEIVGQNGTDAPVFTDNLSNVLDLDLLGLLEAGETAIVEFDPATPVDRITVGLSSLVGVGLDQNIKIYDVYRAPATPTITATADDLNICTGSSTMITAEVENANNVELRWYDASEDGNLLATLNSGDAFTTPTLTEDTTYYIASAEIGCTQESPRTEVEVNVEPIPTAADISVLGNENAICSSNNVVLVPSSDIDGTFLWYFDDTKTNGITNGLEVDGVTYEIDSNGVMTITGLTETGGPYTYYVAVKNDLAGCENASGNLKAVEVNVVDGSKTVNIDSAPLISLSNLIDIFGDTDTVEVTGTVSGDVIPGEPISLAVNGNLYEGLVGADGSFSVDVDAIDLVSDIDNTLEAFLEGMLCTVSEEILVDLPDLLIDDEDLQQTFCASDFPTIADLQIDIEGIVFFDDLSAGLQLGSDTALVDGQVYFAGLLNIPTSILARVRIGVEITDVPTPTTTSAEQTFCDSDMPLVGDIQTDQTNVVFYDAASGGNAIDPSIPIENGGTYHVAAIENGCESSARLRVSTTVIQDGSSPITLTGESEKVCRGRSYTYVANADKEGYDWDILGGTITDGGTATDDFVTVTWTEMNNTEISVSYTDESTCSPTKMVSLGVEVISCGMVLGEEFCLKVFNEFSPNNDGFNDVFTVQCIEDYSNTIEIYNRNGNLVYKTADYQNTWKGLANVKGVLNNGDQLPSGTYYYSIQIPELERNLVGWLQLAR